MKHFVKREFYKVPKYPLDGTLGGSQGHCGCCVEENQFLPMQRINLIFLDSPAHSLLAVLTELFTTSKAPRGPRLQNDY
jgi:hypothetical protein